MRSKPPWRLLIVFLLAFEFLWGAEDYSEDYKSVDLSQLELLQDCAVRTSKNSLQDNKFLAIVKNSSEVSIAFESFYWLQVKLQKTEFWVRSSCLSGRSDSSSPCPLYYDEELKDISPYFVLGKNYKVLTDSDYKKKIKLKYDVGFIGSQCFGLPMMYSEKFKNNFEKIYQKKETDQSKPTGERINKSLFGLSYSPQYFDFQQNDSKENSNEFRLFLTNSFGLSYLMQNENVFFEASYEYKEINFKNDLLGTKYIALNAITVSYLQNNVLPWSGRVGLLVRSEQNPYFLNIDNSIKNLYYIVTNVGPGLEFQHSLYDVNFNSSWFVFQSLYSHNWQSKSKFGFEIKLSSELVKKENFQYGFFVKYTNQSTFLKDKVGVSEIEVNQQIKSTVLGVEIKY